MGKKGTWWGYSWYFSEFADSFLVFLVFSWDFLILSVILSWYFLALSGRYPVAASGSSLFGANLVQVAGGSSRPQNEASLLSSLCQQLENHSNAAEKLMAFILQPNHCQTLEMLNHPTHCPPDVRDGTLVFSSRWNLAIFLCLVQRILYNIIQIRLSISKSSKSKL